jgi:NADPH:quinone reductase-like Zn-dependent oxidoreductase
VNAAPTADKLRLLGELAGSGALRIPIQGVYPIDQAGDAIQAFQQGTRGKLVVRVGSGEDDLMNVSEATGPPAPNR